MTTQTEEQQGWVQAARETVERNGFCMVNPDTGEMIETQWLGDEIDPEADGVVLDLVTANMLVTVHDALSPDKAATFGRMPLLRAVEVGWSLVSRAKGA